MNVTKKNQTKISSGGFLEVLKIALPLILSSSCHAANMFVDRLMLAHYSSEAVAAAFTGGLTNFAIVSLLVGTIGYTGTFVAQYEGARHRDRIGGAVWQGIWMSLAGGVIMATGIWWGTPLFHCLGHDPVVTEQEIAYFAVLCKGTVVFLLSGALSCFWSGRGKTTLVLIVSALITLFNLPLNYVLIFGKCGMPELGTTGAAWGTVLSDGGGVLLYLILFFLPSARKHFHTTDFKIDFPLLKRMLHFGLPSGIQLALDLIAFTTFSLLLGSYGVAVHEASSITFGINNIAFCPVIGVGMTASILVGQAIGAENVPLAKKSVRSCLILVQLYTLVMVILFTLFQGLVLAPFTRVGDAGQAETLRLSSYMLYFICAYLFFDGLNITFSNAIRGAGDTRFPMWALTTVGICVLAIPSLILHHLGQPWWTLWICFDAEILLLSIIFTWRYLQGKWTKMRVIDVPAKPEEAE